MTPSNPFLPKVDLETQKRLALAKVYSLLIRLAEEAKKETAGTLDVVNVDEAKTADPEPTINSSIII